MKITLDMPDDGWFKGSSDFRPKDKQFCVVVFDDTIRVCQYRKCLFDMDELIIGLIRLEYWSWNFVTLWKPIDIPVDVKTRICLKIENWIEEDER